jgi:hypothetical protein
LAITERSLASPPIFLGFFCLLYALTVNVIAARCPFPDDEAPASSFVLVVVLRAGGAVVSVGFVMVVLRKGREEFVVVVVLVEVGLVVLGVGLVPMRRKLEEDGDSVADGSSLLARVLEVEYVVDSVELVVGVSD